MFDAMDIDYDFDMPGGDDYEDVSPLFHRAAKDMAPEDIILTDGFTLTDAMSAFEIGEPRMDSGMTLPQDESAFFDPLAPLLPEEICWILDRMFACEMSWHSGNTLSQTVFTLLYIHELSDINPDLIPGDWPEHPDPNRPLELITVVLRGAVFGLLKSCDLAWRELSRKRVYDIEDWQSEKCEVSLLEGVPVDVVLRRLEEAFHWLQAAQLPPEHKDALLNRLMLRRYIIELLNLNLTENLDSIRPIATLARKYLREVQKHPSRPPVTESRALAVFDTRVTRRLHTVIPIRIVELPEQAVVWQAIERLLDSFEEVDHLRSQHSIISWQIFGSCATCAPQNPLPAAYIRSLLQGVFFDQQVVLEQYPISWLVEQFFLETLGLSYERVSEILSTGWTGHDSLNLQDLEVHLVQIVSNHIKLFWFNPPRRRRHLMKSVVQWQSLEDAFRVLAAQVVVSSSKNSEIVKILPEVASTWKLGNARDIILSGFQQDLYTSYERPFAYWLLAHITEQHIHSLETLCSHGTPERKVREEWEYQTQFLRATQMMCSALFAMTSFISPPSPDRMALNFRRRYKWLFVSQDDNPSELLFQVPPLSRYTKDMEEVTTCESFPARESLRTAEEAISRLLSMNAQTLCGAEEASMRVQFARDLVGVSQKLLQLVGESRIEPKDLVDRLRWDAGYHPWFPSVIPAK